MGLERHDGKPIFPRYQLEEIDPMLRLSSILPTILLLQLDRLFSFDGRQRGHFTGLPLVANAIPSNGWVQASAKLGLDFAILRSL